MVAVQFELAPVDRYDEVALGVVLSFTNMAIVGLAGFQVRKCHVRYSLHCRRLVDRVYGYAGAVAPCHFTQLTLSLQLGRLSPVSGMRLSTAFRKSVLEIFSGPISLSIQVISDNQVAR